MLIPLHSIPPKDQPVKPPRAVHFLIIANIIVYACQLYLHYRGTSLAMTHGATPRQMTHIVPFLPFLPNLLDRTLITSLFLHDIQILQGGFIHLIGNMLYLSAFGPHLEHVIGRLKFLVFYLLCGVLATLFYVVFHYDSTAPLIGASGAIAGVMGAHFIACPKSRIRCLFLIYVVPLPAIVVLLPWAAIQLLNAYLHQGTPVAWLAHIGGFFFGLLLIKKFDRVLKGLSPSTQNDRSQSESPRNRIQEDSAQNIYLIYKLWRRNY